MADLKQFLDFPGLQEYDKLIKEYIKTGSTDEIDKINLKDSAQDEQIAALNNALAILNSDDTVAGSVDAKVKKAVDDLVNNAPEAFDTLKEIADWINDDESGAATLVSRVKDNEKKIENLKEYVDAQDEDVYNSIKAIENVKIASLFATKQAEDKTVAETLAELGEDKAVQLAADQTIEEDLVISKSCYIDANGSTFTGVVTVPADADVIIENATFSQPVQVK